MGLNKSKGDNLEMFVEKLEKLLLPEGLKIERNKRVYDDKTQVGELDLLITGTIGSFSVNWLIECRDRPSDGPQGRDWVQQLIGRRDDYKVDKIVGVSTTGFSDGAYKLAEKENISLREVKEASKIIDEFSLVKFLLSNPSINAVGEIKVAKIVPLRVNNSKALDNFEFNSEMQLKYDGESKYFPWLDFFINHKQHIFFDEKKNTPQFFYYQSYKPLIVKFENSEYRIYNFRAMLCYDNIPYEGKTLALKSYSENNKIIGQEVAVIFNTPLGAVNINLMVSSTNGSGKGHFNIVNIEIPEKIKKRISR